MRLLLVVATLGAVLGPGVVLRPGAAVAQPANPSFNLVNRSDQAINEVYATPTGVDRWGRDRLAQSYLPPGQTFPVRLPAGSGCSYDVRVVYADGKPEERRRLDSAGSNSVTFPAGRAGTPTGAAAGQAEADDPSFRLVNRSRADLNELYVSASGNENWGRDRLGDDTVPAGSTRVVRLPRGECQYDVRAVFANGEATEKRRLDLCAITDLRVP